MKHLFTFLVLLALPFTVTFAQGLHVTSVSPAPHALNVPREDPIVVEFDAGVSILSITDASFRAFGRWSGPVEGSFTVENGNQRVIFTPDDPFMAGEYITVTLSSAIENPPLTNNLNPAYQWSFWTSSLPQPLEFFPVDTLPIRNDGEGWIQSYGAYAGDLNNDGFSDLTVINERSIDARVFLNDGFGFYNQFTTYAITDGRRPSANEPGDFNSDGEIDLAIANTDNAEMSLLFGDGTGAVPHEASYESKPELRGIGVLDVNSDGIDDVVVTNKTQGSVSLHINDGTGVMNQAITIEPGGDGEHALATGDFDNDGLLDVVVGAQTSQELFILKNDGAGNLTPVDTLAINGNPWMVAVGDVDQDGNLDVASANSNVASITIAFGDGTGQLTNPTNYPTGAFPLAVDLGDLDGDGDLDVVSSNFNGIDYTIYENDGTGTFINQQSIGALGAGSCAVIHDRDNDGDMDLTFIDEIDDLLLIFDDDSTLATIGIDEVQAERIELTSAPNPFTTQTSIQFTLTESAKVTCEVFNLSGQKVRDLKQANFGAGKHSITWNGMNNGGKRLADGHYIIAVKTPQKRGVHMVNLMSE